MAGTAVGKLKTGTVDRTNSYVKAWEVQFTADASAATFPVYTLPTDFAANITDISFVFDATTPPDSLTYLVKDGYGLTILAETTITASSGRDLLGVNYQVVNGGTVTLTGNSTNSAKVKVVFYILS